ncbi:uncharacterized protein METZ01_LOCUS367493 [marine metagenome]|uniref:Uncharacterized protein n=1 Tax=marine metagenome TaxID=408172 RepID=A0A382SXI5_9ZZZZ
MDRFLDSVEDTRQIQIINATNGFAVQIYN